MENINQKKKRIDLLEKISTCTMILPYYGMMKDWRIATKTSKKSYTMFQTNYKAFEYCHQIEIENNGELRRLLKTYNVDFDLSKTDELKINSNHWSFLIEVVRLVFKSSLAITELISLMHFMM